MVMPASPSPGEDRDAGCAERIVASFETKRTTDFDLDYPVATRLVGVTNLSNG
jgi:hypothetical protein